MQPDILAKASRTTGNKVFTLHLRPDTNGRMATPFTAEDFRFQWEDILTDKDMDRGGLDHGPLAGRQAAEVRGHRRPDRPLHLGLARIRCFLPGLPARGRSISTAASAYLKQFHAKYADA